MISPPARRSVSGPVPALSQASSQQPHQAPHLMQRPQQPQQSVQGGHPSSTDGAASDAMVRSGSMQPQQQPSPSGIVGGSGPAGMNPPSQHQDGGNVTPQQQQQAMQQQQQVMQQQQQQQYMQQLRQQQYMYSLGMQQQQQQSNPMMAHFMAMQQQQQMGAMPFPHPGGQMQQGAANAMQMLHMQVRDWFPLFGCKPATWHTTTHWASLVLPPLWPSCKAPSHFIPSHLSSCHRLPPGCSPEGPPT